MSQYLAFAVIQCSETHFVHLLASCSKDTIISEKGSLTMSFYNASTNQVNCKDQWAKQEEKQKTVRSTWTAPCGTDEPRPALQPLPAGALGPPTQVAANPRQVNCPAHLSKSATITHSNKRFFMLKRYLFLMHFYAYQRQVANRRRGRTWVGEGPNHKTARKPGLLSIIHYTLSQIIRRRDSLVLRIWSLLLSSHFVNSEHIPRL